ncbi:MAG: cold shock domain-containing protein [Actinobacteria bacterium]|nr:cold shock domain-containing protein [Actinomycetota bacterium]
MTDSKKRIALKPHIKQIREWVDAGKADDWIADALGTSASSVQSFRSRNDIYRRERGASEPVSVFEGVLDHGERDGWGMWFDPAVADDPVWREHWAGVESVVVKVAEDAIILEIAGEAAQSPAQDVPQAETNNGSGPRTGTVETVPAPAEVLESAAEVETEDLDTDREQGRVKWFDPEKGYGFLVRPTGEDLFVHHSEVEGDPSALEPGGEIEYVVGRNDRGPNARSVRLVE